jgi:hypothetical protein
MLGFADPRPPTWKNHFFSAGGRLCVTSAQWDSPETATRVPVTSY